MRFFFSINLVSTLFYFEFQIIILSNNQQQLIFQQNILLLFNISFFFLQVISSSIDWTSYNCKNKDEKIFR